jgi:putative DNA primase/helicase
VTPPDLAAAIAEVQAGNLATGLEFLAARVLNGKDPAACYAEDFIRAVAAAKGSEARDIAAKLQAKFGKDFRVLRFNADVREAKEELARAAIDHQGDPSNLIRGSNGSVLVGYENAMLYFQHSPDWAGVLGYNEFTGGHELRKSAPPPVTQKPGEEIEDSFDTDATRWLERRSHLMFKADLVHRIIDVLAKQNSFHPVRDYLASLPKWDGVERLSSWLFAYCGVDPGSDTKPNHYAATIGRRFLIGMVARVLSPGCKCEHMLVLEGKTGIGKSSVAKALCPNEKWFTDQVDMESKDAPQKVRGVWIVEFADLDGFSRAEEKTAKRWLSQQEERFRMPYGRRLTRYPRQCSFIATTERSDWMRAETGRRFWPVLTTRIDFEAVIRDRDLLWAEALQAFKAGERWHLAGSEEISEATEEQRKRFAEDIWRERVLAITDALTDQGEDWIATDRIVDKMNIPTAQQNDLVRSRVGAILRIEGWKRKQMKVGKRPVYGFQKPEATE